MTAFPACCSLRASSASTSSRPFSVNRAWTTGHTVYSLPDFGCTRVAPPASQLSGVHLPPASSFLSLETRTQRCERNDFFCCARVFFFSESFVCVSARGSWGAEERERRMKEGEEKAAPLLALFSFCRAPLLPNPLVFSSPLLSLSPSLSLFQPTHAVGEVILEARVLVAGLRPVNDLLVDGGDDVEGIVASNRSLRHRHRQRQPRRRRGAAGRRRRGHRSRRSERGRHAGWLSKKRGGRTDDRRERKS